MLPEDAQVIISEVEIKEMFFEELTALGYAVGEDELEDIADIAFDIIVDIFLNLSEGEDE